MRRVASVLFFLLSMMAMAGPGWGGGQHVTFVYLGSLGCGGCRSPEIKEAVALARATLGPRVTGAGNTFSSVVISTDATEERGRSFVDRHAPGFDHEWIVPNGIELLGEKRQPEAVILKRGLLDRAVVDAIWGYRPQPDELPIVGLPQIVVLERSGDETRVVFHVLGSVIPLWAEAGASLAERFAVPGPR